jgi:hypothetical protein
MEVPDGDRNHANVQADGYHRCQANAARARVAKLAEVIVPPARDTTRTPQHAAVGVANINRRQASTNTRDVNRRQVAPRGSIAELALTIPAPALHTTAAYQRTAMAKARRDSGRHRPPTTDLAVRGEVDARPSPTEARSARERHSKNSNRRVRLYRHETSEIRCILTA